MPVEHGKIEGNMSLDHELTLHGIVIGNITVDNNGVLFLHGMCCQNLTVKEGAKVYLYGMVVGNVLNHGGHLEVYGTVGGYLHTTENGNTFIDQNALVVKTDRHDNEESQPKTRTLLPEAIDRYLEPAAIFTLLVSAVYYLGWSYVDAYFERLGVHHNSLELPASFYIKESFFTLVIALTCVFISFFDIKDSPRTKLDAARGNLIGFLAAILVSYTAIDRIIMNPYQYTAYFMLAMVGLLTFGLILVSWRKESFAHRFRNASSTLRLLVIILILSASVSLARTLGKLRATEFIEGSPRNVVAVDFAWKSYPPANLWNKQLLLVIYRNGKYYVIVKQKPAPRFPELYIVPNDQIEYAITKRVN